MNDKVISNFWEMAIFFKLYFTKQYPPIENRVTPPKKSRNTLIRWSREKSKAFYFHFHKVYGHQT